MKIFDIVRTFPRSDKKQFKSVEELLEYFKLNYLIEFEFTNSKRWESRGATSFYYSAIVHENGYQPRYILTVVMSDTHGLVTWKVSVNLTVGSWYKFDLFPMES